MEARFRGRPKERKSEEHRVSERRSGSVWPPRVELERVRRIEVERAVLGERPPRLKRQLEEERRFRLGGIGDSKIAGSQQSGACKGCGGGESSLDSENKALVVSGDLNPWCAVGTDRRVGRCLQGGTSWQTSLWPCHCTPRRRVFQWQWPICRSQRGVLRLRLSTV